jgi:hypothetical protein
MSKNAPCARRPSGQTVPSSPDPRTSPRPPRAGMIVLPAEVFLMLIRVIVLPFLPRNHFARRFLLVHVFLMPTTLGGVNGGRLRASYTTRLGVIPHIDEPCGSLARASGVTETIVSVQKGSTAGRGTATPSSPPARVPTRLGCTVSRAGRSIR